MTTRWKPSNWRHEYFQIAVGSGWQTIGRIDRAWFEEDGFINCHTTWQGLRLLGFRRSERTERRLVEIAAIRQMEKDRPWFYVPTIDPTSGPRRGRKAAA